MPVVTVSESTAVRQQEDPLVETVTLMLTSKDYTTRLIQIQTIPNEYGLVHYSVSLEIVQKHSSIAWYFVCKTLAGLEQLKRLYDSEQLVTMFEEIINCVLNINEGHHLRVEWNDSEYERCREQVTRWSASSHLTLASRFINVIDILVAVNALLQHLY